MHGRPRAGVARPAAPLAHGAEDADLCADGRHRRGADDVAPRVDRRRAQLGLPVLLAARRHPDAPRASAGAAHRRGDGLAQVAAARGRGRPRGPPDHVQRRRRAAPHRARAAVAPGLRGLRAGAHRQRGERAASDRRLRRGDGRALPGARCMASERNRTPGRSRRRCSATSNKRGTGPTTASGRSAAGAGTSCTRR